MGIKRLARKGAETLRKEKLQSEAAEVFEEEVFGGGCF